jgi:hypothetical protein
MWHHRWKLRQTFLGIKLPERITQVFVAKGTYLYSGTSTQFILTAFESAAIHQTSTVV